MDWNQWSKNDWYFQRIIGASDILLGVPTAPYVQMIPVENCVNGAAQISHRNRNFQLKLKTVDAYILVLHKLCITF